MGFLCTKSYLILSQCCIINFTFMEKNYSVSLSFG